MNEPPPFHLGYQRGLDGLRGLAIALVVVCHGKLLGNGFGFIGVNTFFVLSGFLITALLVSEWKQSGTIRFGHFYLRRALRLLPALVVMLLVFTVYALVSLPAGKTKPEIHGVFWALFYFTNWAHILSLQNSIYLGHTWSLSVEEQFYLVWPLVLLWLLKKQPGKPILRWIVLGVFLSVMLRFLLFAGTIVADINPDRLSEASDTRADSLLLGCFIGVVVSMDLFSPNDQIKTLMKVSAPMALAGLLSLGIFRVESPGMVSFGWLLASILAAFLILSLVFAPGSLRWLFENRAMVWLGRFSYGLYLWHYPILIAMRERGLPWQHLGYLLPAGAVTVASFYLVEKPCLRWKKKFAHAE